MPNRLLRKVSRMFSCKRCGTVNRGILIALLVAALAIGYATQNRLHADRPQHAVMHVFPLEGDTRKGHATPVEELQVLPAHEDAPRIIAEEWGFSLSLGYLAELIAGEIRKQGKDKVMVFDFHDRDGKVTPLGLRVTHEVSKSLAAQPDLRVVRVSAPAGDPFGDIDEALEAGLSLGADVVCVGRVYGPADVTRMELQVIDVDSKQTLFEGGMPVPKDDEPGPIQTL